MDAEKLERISDFVYELPQGAKRGMRVPARIYADERLIASMDNAVLDQIANVAMLPGIQRHAVCMPDGHSGYGFPIGGVAAIDPDDGVISPGGIGFDINCGIRLVRTSLGLEELKPRLKNLVDSLYTRIPSGVGCGGVVSLGHGQMDAAMTRGARWAVENGHGLAEDLECIEENGCVPGADPAAVSKKARERGREQVGSLGSGNHFLEVSMDETDTVWLFLHSGSRGVGNKIAQHHISVAKRLMEKWWITLPDPDLAYLVEGTAEFGRYIDELTWAQHFALLNREEMMDRVVRQVSEWMHEPVAELDRINCHHNFTQKEHHFGKEVWLSRKGAISAREGELGLIPGSMGTASYVVEGLGNAVALNSSPHGAGREYSRSAARRQFTADDLRTAMAGIEYRDTDAFIDEIPAAYKPIDQVMADAADLVKVRHTLRQLVNVKGD